MIYILTGEIKTGKTTRLLKWIELQKNCAGIVSPVINSKRHLLCISTKEIKPLEADTETNDHDIICIGKYSFDNKTFQWGKEILNRACRQNKEWLIIDEIGPLELRGKGFEPAACELINLYKTKKESLLVVVRKPLYNKFIQHYGLRKEEVHLIEV